MERRAGNAAPSISNRFFTASNAAINVDPSELETARWYARGELLASPENETFRLPRRDPIARRLIADWLAG
jgi:NAD+ diphosphatase